MERSRRRYRRLIVVLIAVAALVAFATTYTEWLWFRSAGQAADRAYENVYTRVLLTSSLCFAVVGVLVFLVLYGNLRRARKKPETEERYIGPSVFQYLDREMIDEYVDRWVLWGSLAIAVLCALLAKNRWFQLLQFTHAQPFGATDPVFGLDISFYVFRLPFLEYVFVGGLTLTMLTLVVTVVMHLYEDRVFVTADGVKVTVSARRHIWALAAVALFLNALRYVSRGFELLFTRRELFHGASYTDLHGRLWLFYVSAALSLLLGVYLLVRRRSTGDIKPELIGLGAMLAVAIVIGNIVPRVMQLYVRGGERSIEGTYINRNIEATRKAYGLESIPRRSFPALSNLSPQDLERNQATIQSIRLWDHRPLRDVYTQQEQLYPYYQFVDIDADRYIVNGRLRQVLLSARELNLDGLPQQSRTWQNTHMVYTHGYGISMSPVDAIGKEGLPEYFISGLPAKADPSIPLRNTAIYFGEFGYGTPESRKAEVSRMFPTGGPYDDRFVRGQSAGHVPPFIVVGGHVKETDYPLGKDRSAETTYSGKAGVSVGGLFRRLLLALRFRSGYILVSPDITRDSRVLMHREIRERASALAPILALDLDPYIALDKNGDAFWIIDGYTSTARYPYSTASGWSRGAAINYLRNSVKITIDAYDGTVRFFVCNEGDPLLRTYRSMFPELFQPLAQMPEDRRAHLRYPLSQFIKQSEMLIRYHVVDAQKFYSGEQFWKWPDELYGPTRRDAQPAQPAPGSPLQAAAPDSGEGQQAVRMLPYYIVMRIPGQEKEQFVLMLPFTRQDRPNMAAWLGAYWRDEGPDLELFEFPEDRVVWGPMQFEAKVDNDARISPKLSLWGQGGSFVIRGNTLIIPIEDSLLYVEPVYIQAQATALPALKQVVVAYGERLEMRDTLDEALRAVLGQPPAQTSQAPPEETPGMEPGTAPSVQEQGKGTPREENLVVPAEVLDRLDEQLRKATDAQGTAQSELEALREAVEGLRKSQ